LKADLQFRIVQNQNVHHQYKNQKVAIIRPAKNTITSFADSAKGNTKHHDRTNVYLDGQVRKIIAIYSKRKIIFWISPFKYPRLSILIRVIGCPFLI